MDFLVSIVLTLVGAVVGAAISILVPIWLSYRRYDAAPDITGTWLGAYQAAALPGHPWIREDTKIWRQGGKFRFAGYNNPQHDEIEGDADLFGLDHLIGRWRQLDKRGPNHGVFMFTISPTGRLMYGFWVGVTETGEKRFGAWVLARDEQDIEQGKNLLHHVTIKMATGGDREIRPASTTQNSTG
ncbi:MAG TPA: hypothetical protein DCZ05_09810 [Deltaproteobacteria bacterium]|nr:hypothetical protein [Deltaproteobacteria bacterium]